MHNISIKATGNRPLRFLQKLVATAPYFYRYTYNKKYEDMVETETL